MSYPLGIYSPLIGAVTETFIGRHIHGLLPGGTAVLGQLAEHSDGRTVDGPHLPVSFGQPKPSSLPRTVAAMLRSLWPMTHLHPVKRFLRKHGTEVLMGEYLDASLPLLPIARDLGIRFFVHAHGYDASELLRDPYWRERFLEYNSADGIITMSQASRERLIGIGIHPGAIHVIPYGVDVPPRPCRRTRGSTVRCLAVGRMVEKKGPILMLDSFRRAAEVFPGLTLDYIGDGVLLPAVRQYIRASGLEDAVHLHGACPNADVLELMETADIFIQHSIRARDTEDEEGLPVAILEAMAHALPVVSTRHAGIPEAVLEGSTGYLVEEGDTAAMSRQILALAQDPELRETMGLNGWERASAHYSWGRERTDLLECLGLESSVANP